MDTKEVVVLKEELGRRISELLKEFEVQTELHPDSVEILRRPVFDSLGRENDYNYIVEVKVCF